MSNAPTRGQLDAIEQLREVERASSGAVEIQRVSETPEATGWLPVEFSVLCRELDRRAGGLPLRDRERFVVLIPPDFPFELPSVWTTHRRFSGHPHVQWGRYLCLYQSTETEWDASDGMFGFLARLNQWLTQGALNEFEPVGAPLHPPVAYTTRSAGLVIPRVDTPDVGIVPWVGFVNIAVISDSRVDLVGWREVGDGHGDGGPPSEAATAADAADGALHRVGVAVLLNQSMPFEYPKKVSDLFAQLAEREVSQRHLFLALMLAALENPKEAPLYTVIGTPSRGLSGARERQQHLAVWKLAPVVADSLRLCVNQFSESARLRQIGEEMEAAILDWASVADLEWCVVREARPEVTVRRDVGTPMSVFAGRAVSLWGAGALGGPVAEFLVRAGVRRLIIRDSGVVAPGLLVRQPFLDSDIGRAKSEALAERLRRIDPRADIVALKDDLLQHPLADADWTDGADIVIDASASARVLEKLELRRQDADARRVPVVAMAVDHRAERGLVTVAPATHSGGSADVIRRAKLEVCGNPELGHFADAFWSGERRHPVFQPEPGCSANTFIGSAADLAGLAARMVNAAARDLAARMREGEAACSATAHLFFQLPTPNGQFGDAHFSWPADVVSRDPQTNFEIRIALGAWREIQGWVSAGRRMLGEDVETGGVLFGEHNDASRVIWVDEVIGPPPDSWSAPEGFICGTDGVAEANAEKSSRTRGSVAFVGMWHTHPESVPLPSSTDLAGMAHITAAGGSKTPKALLLIVGYTVSETPVIGSYLFTRREFEESGLGFFKTFSDERHFRELRRGPERLRRPREQRKEAQIAGRIVTYNRTCELRRAPTQVLPKRVALALSGGGSRAIAFHLGCLRALHDRGVLEQVRTLSTVSGGSVIGAMYAYGEYPDFAAFDAAVVRLLQVGLVSTIARHIIAPQTLLPGLTTAATAGVAALAADLARRGAGIATLFPPLERWRNPHLIQRIQPPFRRWVSRTSAFERALRDSVFGARALTDIKREGLELVINATELRTGTAFRFGSRTSGSSRFGALIDGEIDLALAVAASAAYPALLPAIDREFNFKNRRGEVSRRRVLLTDGGVYDNLGTACLEPRRDPNVSEHVAEAEFIIACDAGVGVEEGTEIPYWWGTRMMAAFETIFRRVQNSSRNRLHLLAASGQVRGFVLSYLGQADGRLPWAPPDLVPRAAVVDYPTDFAAMSDTDIDLLSNRGEQLTRLLIAHYIPSI